jgi:CheY-like chemotaxis protein
LAIVLGGFLLYRMALSIFEGQLAFGPPVAVDPALSAEQRLAEEAQVEQFIAAFGEPTSDDAVGVPDFPDWAPEQVAELRNLFSEVCRSNQAASRQRMFAELSRGLRQVKERASLPGLGPILQLASTLEELFKQLAKKEPTLTASELQTAAAGLDVLHKLCLSASDLEMAADRRVKFLVVDDDAVSRHALSVALKRAFAEPDLVPNGEIALAMATRQSYDVIFLDVEMPGMDGFEICSKILETAPNCTTPVVFVTLHSDFDSRAAGVLSGGRHLIGKPFMPSELAVKALTLAFEARHAFT